MDCKKTTFSHDHYEETIQDYFRTKEDDDEGHHLVGTISSEISQVIDANTNKVLISNISINKNIKNHQDLTLDDYKKLEILLAKNDFIIKDGEKTVGIVVHDDQLYYYALKATATGSTIFLSSFRKTSEKDINRLRKKSGKLNCKLLKDEL